MVFSFAMCVLGAASRTRLDMYQERVAKLSEEYAEMWWLTPISLSFLRILPFASSMVLSFSASVSYRLPPLLAFLATVMAKEVTVGSWLCS